MPEFPKLKLISLIHVATQTPFMYRFSMDFPRNALSLLPTSAPSGPVSPWWAKTWAVAQRWWSNWWCCARRCGHGRRPKRWRWRQPNTSHIRHGWGVEKPGERSGKTWSLLGKPWESWVKPRNCWGKPCCFLFSRTNFGILRLGT